MQISYSELRQHLKQMIDVASDTNQAVVITNRQKPKAVLLSYDDYLALEETAYLLQSPANAKRLLQAVNDIKQSKSLLKQKIDLDEA